jgi:hypothetical protein
MCQQSDRKPHLAPSNMPRGSQHFLQAVPKVAAVVSTGTPVSPSEGPGHDYRPGLRIYRQRSLLSLTSTVLKNRMGRFMPYPS